MTEKVVSETLDEMALRIWDKLKVDWSQRLYLPSLVNTNCDDFISEYARRLLSAHAARADPVAWKVIAKGGKFTRGLYERPTANDFEIWKLDGDHAIPLYAAPQMQEAPAAPQICGSKKMGEYDDLYCCAQKGHVGEHCYVVDNRPSLRKDGEYEKGDF